MKSKVISGGILSLCGAATILSAGICSAANPATAPVSVNVAEACILSRSGGGSYSTTLAPGTLDNNITGSTFSITCNDTSGWRLTAIGYGNSTDGDTSMHLASGSETIATGTATGGSNPSSWAMSLVAGTGVTLDNGFGSFSQVPAEETRVAYASTKSTNVTVTSKYQVYASQDQAPGSYTGVVKYTLAHPAVVPEPSKCGTTPTMQNLDKTLFGTTDAQVQLCDERDGKTYWAAKLADGNIWMTQNLDLELSTTKTLTPDDSDVSANWTPNRSTQNGQYKGTNGLESAAIWNSDYNTVDHSYRPASDPHAGTSGDYGNDGDTYFSPVYMKNGTTMQAWKTEAECTGAGNSAELCQHWNVGTFYSWYAATAGTGNSSVTSRGTNVSDSICPKGWHLPSSTSSGEFQNLVTEGGITASNITGAPYYFLRAGYYSGSHGAVYNTGGYGFYWSSTSASSTGYAYSLYFHSSNVDPSYNANRYFGFGVRCLAAS